MVRECQVVLSISGNLHLNTNTGDDLVETRKEPRSNLRIVVPNPDCSQCPPYPKCRVSRNVPVDIDHDSSNVQRYLHFLLLYSAPSLFPYFLQSVLKLVDVVIDDGFSFCWAIVSHDADQSKISALVSGGSVVAINILTDSFLSDTASCDLTSPS